MSGGLRTMAVALAAAAGLGGGVAQAAAPNIAQRAPGLAWSAGLPYPPDQFGAIGPEHYVQGVTNTGVAVFRRSDLGLTSGPLPARTFSGAPSGSEVVDTQMMWDAQTSRWYYAWSYKKWVNNVRTAGLLYGWSKTSDPTDLANGWCKMRIDNGADFDDRPKLGDNRTHLIIATNADPWGGADFDRVWTMPKPPNGSTSCPPAPTGVKVFGSVSQPLRTSDGDVADSAIVAQDNDGAEDGWIVAADSHAGTGSQIMLWHVDSGGDLIADGNIAVAPYVDPPAPPQPGSNQPLDPVDARLGSAIADTDPDVGAAAVWASHTIADPSGSGRSVVRWYEIVPSACAPASAGNCSTAARRQQGEVDDPDTWLFNAAMAPTDAGDEAVLHYDSASKTQLVQVRARARGSQTPLGTLDDEVVVDTSEAAYDEPTCHDDRPYCRWGDYAAATTDPSDPHTVWGSNQAIGPANAGKPNWKTVNFALQPAQAPPSPSGPPSPPPEGPPPDPPADPPVGPVPPPGPRGSVNHKRGEIAVMSRNLFPGGDQPGQRMRLVAREIVRSGPDLVGLQEAAPVGTLKKELAGLGARYRVVTRGRRAGTAVLARAGVKVTHAVSRGGYDGLDAKVRGRRLHFVNVRSTKAHALLRGPLSPRKVPTVVVGDVSSRRLEAAGFTESRTLSFNCCFSGDLADGVWDRVAGHVMTRPLLRVVSSYVTGFGARTPGGVAASDHGGVVSVLR